MRHSVLMFFCCFILASCSRNLSDILGIDEINLEGKIYSKDTTGINGEGYLFEIYSLSAGTVKTFVSSSSKSEYPSKNSYIDDVKNWSKTPLNDEKVLELVLSNYTTDIEEKKMIASLRKALSSINNYYAYGYSKTDGAMYRIEFYLLDIKENKLYVFENDV